MLEEHEVFSELDAFQESRIIYIDNFYFERPTARIVDAITQLKDLYRILFENKPAEVPDDNVGDDDNADNNDDVDE